MRVLLWGTYDTGKPRARILRAGMRAAGIDVEEIHADIWSGVEDKSQVKGLRSRLRLLVRWTSVYPRLTWQLTRARKPDILLVAYPGLLDAFVASAIGRLRKIPVAWDVFISLYDTIVDDRKLLHTRSIFARLLHWLEGMALRSVNLAFMDTKAHARRIELLFDLPSESCGAVWVGVEAEHFTQSVPVASYSADESLKVLFYGQFIPLHGIPTIVEAARLLRNAPIAWTLIGRGQEASKIRDMLAVDPLPQVRWIEWVDYEKLREEIAAADLCLGIFGESKKAESVIPNKVFQIVAAGRPLITRDSPAIRELLHPSIPCTYLVEAGNPNALADAIQHHANSVRLAKDVTCHRGILEQVDAYAVGVQFLALASRLAGAQKASEREAQL